jgi:hypothetical protein
MREQLAQVEQQAAQLGERANNLASVLEQDRALLRDTGEQLRDLKRFFSDVARQVGHHALIAGKVPKFVSYVPNDTWWRMPVSEPVPAVDFSDASPMMMASVQDEILHLLEVDAIRDVFAHRLNVRVRLAGGAVGYGISVSALMSEGRDRLAARIAPELATALVDLLKKEGIR